MEPVYGATSPSILLTRSFPPGFVERRFHSRLMSEVAFSPLKDFTSDCMDGMAYPLRVAFISFAAHPPPPGPLAPRSALGYPTPGLTFRLTLHGIAAGPHR